LRTNEHFKPKIALKTIQGMNFGYFANLQWNVANLQWNVANLQ
jgi:hypothetical protein